MSDANQAPNPAGQGSQDGQVGYGVAGGYPVAQNSYYGGVPYPNGYQAPPEYQNGYQGYGQVPGQGYTQAVPQAGWNQAPHYVRAQKGHSIILHALFGGFVLWIPSIYFVVSPNHYWHI